ncbi:FxLYD domain-containing protein [Aeoliella sp. ICT_H6.2]|uniref:FxLYD domain-containing protein n=1 Tax=Aeoliella straminimaris TaxID=2954799 RepID=A0A9X2JKA9_9BACT|nr:FxLYD domain-containing protein [Aeoliella straminimaris]MCO6046169.1 FxLYD domain-containing protein [Aeoliella straminimaris]
MFKLVVSAAVLAAVVALPSRVDGRELKTVKFEVLPSSSVALEFKARKVEWVLGKVRIEGTVQNTGPDDYEWVEVVYTAMDRNRNVLGSDIWHVTPFDLSSGMSGEVDGDLIFTKGRIPSIITVEISGETP